MISVVVMNVRSSAFVAAGTSIRQCAQCWRDLTLNWIAKPKSCFSEFVSAGLDPEASFRNAYRIDFF
jgi:hypothetical protein